MNKDGKPVIKFIYPLNPVYPCSFIRVYLCNLWLIRDEI